MKAFRKFGNPAPGWRFESKGLKPQGAVTFTGSLKPWSRDRSPIRGTDHNPVRLQAVRDAARGQQPARQQKESSMEITTTLDFETHGETYTHEITGDYMEVITGELEKRGFTLDEVLNSGLIVPDKKGGHRDYFIPGVYVYPHKDNAGKTCDFTIKDPKKKYNYRLAGQHRIPGAPFMNMGAFKGDTVVLVEGENDFAAV
jgi:hypothetical protein